MPWLAAMAGCLAVAAPSRWRAAAIWAVPLSGWALVVALTWPVAMLRELDFATAAFTGRGAGPSPMAAALLIPAAEAQLVALLFFDWLLGAADDDRRRLWRWLTPAIGVVCALAVWQAAVDPALLSRPPWIGLGRAAGAFYDANATGALVALFGPLLASGVTLGTRRRPPGAAPSSGRLVIAGGGAGLWIAHLDGGVGPGLRRGVAVGGRRSWRVTVAAIAAGCRAAHRGVDAARAWRRRAVRRCRAARRHGAHGAGRGRWPGQDARGTATATGRPRCRSSPSIRGWASALAPSARSSAPTLRPRSGASCRPTTPRTGGGISGPSLA